MSKMDWFHNFKITAVPGFCNNPQSGFLRNYEGDPSECQKTVEKFMDFCMGNVVGKDIPELLTNGNQANSAGQAIGICTFSAYRASLKSA